MNLGLKLPVCLLNNILNELLNNILNVSVRIYINIFTLYISTEQHERNPQRAMQYAVKIISVFQSAKLHTHTHTQNDPQIRNNSQGSAAAMKRRGRV